MDIIHSGKVAFAYPEGEAYMEYEITGDILTVMHTRVPEELGGRGIAGKLAEEVAAFAKAKSFTLKSECSYMTGWLQKHPQA
jgi:uncharacterized protein